MALKFEVGQEVVAMLRPGVPVQCNGENNPDHPCRVRLVKVGRTRVYGFMTGDTARPTALATNTNQRGLLAVAIGKAKRRYAEALRSYGHNEDRIAQLVNAL